MQIIPKKDIENFSLPLPIYKTIHIADAVSKGGEEFKIFVGLDQELVEQLVKYSADESDADLQKYTRDRKRFVEVKYEDWYKKNRTPFALVHKATGVMAALVRFGPEHLFEEVSNWHTAGWRSYHPWRGRGLMKDFSNFAINFYLKYHPNIRIWITARKENAGSVKLATDLGFKIDRQRSNRETAETGHEALVMIK